MDEVISSFRTIDAAKFILVKVLKIDSWVPADEDLEPADTVLCLCTLFIPQKFFYCEYLLSLLFLTSQRGLE